MFFRTHVRNPFRHSGIPRGGVLACASLLGSVRVAGGAEHSAEHPATAAGTVTFSQDASTLTLANQEVRLVFDKAHGSLKSLVYGGRELLAGGGGYVQVASTGRDDPFPTRWEPRVVRDGPGLVEIAFVNVDPKCPLDLAAHYVLRADEPGFHNYLSFGHDAARSPGVHTLAQYNFALRVDPALFTTAAVDDRRIRPFPPADQLTPDRLVMDSTYQLPDGGYYSKYFYSAEMDERHTVHGAMGEHVGVWVVMPSHEHLNGGPEHQELTVHQAGGSQVLLAHATAAHYGAGTVVSDSRDGSWSKVTAPWFVYVNSGDDRAALWRDAKARGARAAADWPYAWLDVAQFQLKRGAVSGRLTVDGHQPVAGARVILAEHEEHPSPLAWQQQWRGYRFYGWADADGRFDIGKVRPGHYDLYAYQPGRFGQFVRRGVRVEAEKSTPLGELAWPLPTGRRTLWQIGLPDRSAAEFGFAGDFRQWGLWREIAAAAPDGVTYVVGRSGPRDWPFEMAVTQNKDLTWHAPAWRVQFTTHDEARAGKSVLTLGVAAYEGKQTPQLTVSLNGRPARSPTWRSVARPTAAASTPATRSARWCSTASY